MKPVVFDLECDGLKPTKIHCLAANGKATTSYDLMRKFCAETEVLVGHNIIRFDVGVLERILDIKVKSKLVDTLALSWYLEPDRPRHGLESYGEEFGVLKPKVDDWDNLTPEEYMHRCKEDVRINELLWDKQWKQLLKLYGSEKEAWRFIDYVMFKLDCAREQEKYGWKLDVEKASILVKTLREERDKKVVELTEAMPRVPLTQEVKRPAKPFKKNGEYSAHGEKWFTLLKEQGLPEDYDGVVSFIKGYEEPNPGSHVQIKDWLYDLGWKPDTFMYKRNKETNETRKIPQVQQDKALGPGLSQSVKVLFKKEPKLEVLEGLSIITHRIAVLEGFLSNVDQNGYVQAQIEGLTNTLRFKHKVVVNLPGVDKPYGADIRGCLVAPKGYELAGSDMSSLEDRTKQHYMWDYDPEYVKEMQTPDFDPHIDLCVTADLMTEDQAQKYKNPTSEFKHTAMYTALKDIRQVGKKVNYTCVYGAGAATVARAANVSIPRAEVLLEAYWKRNWSVRKIGEDQKVKVSNGRQWLYNPVSRFWYSLRHAKDAFSTLNQGTGVYCFDTYVKYLRRGGPPAIAQFHDESVMLVRKGNRDRLKAHVQKAINATNEELKLNRKLDVGLDFGNNYSEIH